MSHMYAYHTFMCITHLCVSPRGLLLRVDDLAACSFGWTSQPRSSGPLVDAFDAEGGGRPPSWAEVPLQPTGAKGTSDVKLETFEDFREGENLKSRQLLVISSSEAPLPGARVNLVVLQPCLGTSSHLRIKF